METPTTNQPTALALRDPDAEAFALVQRKARMYTSSTIVPDIFRGEQNLGNAVIALEMAQRLGAGVLPVMQSIYVVHGKPSWASTFIISCLNTCGRFEPLQFDVSGEDDAKTCIAWTISRGRRLPEGAATLAKAKAAGISVYEGPPVSIQMAKDEGWYGRNGSKWKTLPELMLRYRAATFFGRLFAPELLMGMHSTEEVRETIDIEAEPTPAPRFDGPPEPEKPPAKTESIDPRPAHEVLKELATNAEISDGELTDYLRDRKFAKPDQEWLQLSDAKMRQIITAWNIHKAAIEGRRT